MDIAIAVAALIVGFLLGIYCMGKLVIYRFQCHGMSIEAIDRIMKGRN